MGLFGLLSLIGCIAIIVSNVVMIDYGILVPDDIRVNLYMLNISISLFLISRMVIGYIIDFFK